MRNSSIGVCAAWLVLGCGQFDRELLEDLFDGHGHEHGGGHQGGGGGGHHGGGEGPVATPCNGLFGADDIYRTIANDLARLDADDSQFARYLSLADQANADGCGAVLDSSRAALDKLVNSLSLDSSLTPPVPVDVDLTLYRIDMRDYAWDRPIELDGTIFADGWEAIIASSVYAVPFVGDDADDTVADSGTTVPVLFGDAFVAAAAKAPLYYALLDIPENIDDFLLDDLAIDVAADRADNDVVRAGIGGTGVGRTEFLVERFEIEVRLGSVWQIFSGEGGADALFGDPLGTPDSEERELVFTLPNGLLGHALANGDGQRRDDSDLTLDITQNNFRSLVAASYFRFRSQGVTASDQIRQFALDNPAAFSAPELANILAQYPSTLDLADIFAADRSFFASSLAQIGIDIDTAPEPISQAFLEFDRDVDLATAAGALLVSSDNLASNLNLLDPALSVLDGGFLDRDDFNTFYRNSLCVLSVVNENTPEAGLCEAEAANLP